jgi:hypothetical protein
MSNINEVIATGPPFTEQNIPICRGAAQFEQFADDHPDFRICPVIASTNEENWRSLPGLGYLNRIPGFLYVPVNLSSRASYSGQIELALNAALERPAVHAVRILPPFRERASIGEWLNSWKEPKDEPMPIDFLVRGDDGDFAAVQLGPADGLARFERVIGSFAGSEVLHIGLDEAGRDLASQIAARKPAKLLLMSGDEISTHASNMQFVHELSKTHDIEVENVAYLSSDLLESLEKPIIVNVSGNGKNLTRRIASLVRVLNRHVYIDARTGWEAPLIAKARTLGWTALSGFRGGVHDDHDMIVHLMNQRGETPPDFGAFQTFALGSGDSPVSF